MIPSTLSVNTLVSKSSPDTTGPEIVGDIRVKNLQGDSSIVFNKESPIDYLHSIFFGDSSEETDVETIVKLDTTNVFSEKQTFETTVVSEYDISTNFIGDNSSYPESDYVLSKFNVNSPTDLVKYSDENPTFTDTGAIKIPTGSTSERPPGSPLEPGLLRFNSEETTFEGYNGTAWGPIGGTVGETGGADFGGVEYLEITENTVLSATTNSSKISISANEIGYIVNLPGAATLEENGRLWIISNHGSNGFIVLDGANNPISDVSNIIHPNITRIYYLVDKTNGLWVILNEMDSSIGGSIGETGTTLTSYTPSVFESATSQYISVTALSDTKAIVCYRDNGNSYYGTACVLSISGTTVTAGTPVVFESATSSSISVTTLSDTKAIVCYRDDSNGSYGTACVLSISGTTVTAGTPVVFESAPSDWNSVTALSDTKAIVCYKNSGNNQYGTACVLSISGTTVTAGTPVVFESAPSAHFSVTALSDTKVIVCYEDYGNNGGYGTACVLSISDTTITHGTPVVFESAYTIYNSVTALSDTKAIVCYKDGGNSDYGTACVLSISGTTITYGTPVVFESASSYYNSVTALSDTKAIVCYTDGGNGSYGTACVLSISGTTVTAGTPVVFESANSSYISVTALSDTKAIVCYRDNGNGDYGTSNILTVS